MRTADDQPLLRSRGVPLVMVASDAAPGLVNLSGLMDDAKCFAFVRQHRWPEGVRCPGCDTAAVIRDGCDDSQPDRQRYRCKACARRFDDLTGTVLAGHHQPLRVWVLCLYFMGLNLSNRQIAQELGLNVSDVQAMTEQLRGGLVAKAPPVRLSGEVEIDEVYVVAGHKGQPAAVAKKGGLDAVADWRERRAAARWRRTSHPSWAESSGVGGSSCACWPMCSRRRSSRSSRRPSPRALASTPTSTTSTPACRPWAISTKLSVMHMASTRATRMATASARSTSTRWRGRGPCCALGSVRTGASHKRSCRCISASSSSCTTPGVAAKLSLAPLLQRW